MKLGLVADIHGDLTGFQEALRLLDREGVEHILCAGDILDRGPDADAIVAVIRERGINCIKGNHDHTVVRHQEHWRAKDNPERLAELGRVVSDETVAFVRDLPETARYVFQGVRLLMAHGTPWNDLLGVFPDSRPGVLCHLVSEYAGDTDAVVLGHTHAPMQLQVDGLWVFNPGSVYGVTIRDSHTCATLTLPDLRFEVFNLGNGRQTQFPHTRIG